MEEFQEKFAIIEKVVNNCEFESISQQDRYVLRLFEMSIQKFRWKFSWKWVHSFFQYPAAMHTLSIFTDEHGKERRKKSYKSCYRKSKTSSMLPLY